MSNVLVIHPGDRSTDMLKAVYDGKGYDVINDGSISQEDLEEMKRVILERYNAGDLYSLMEEADALSIKRLTVEVVKAALEKAQVVASKSVSYMGSKGMINLK